MTRSAAAAANNLRAITAITLAMASFACGDTLMKLASASLPTSQLIFIRGVMIFIVSLSIAFFTGALRELRHVFERAMVGRVVGDVGGGWFFQSALARLPYADVTAIGQLSPMMLTAASALFLGERVGWRRWTATAVGFVGILIIIRPGGSAFTLVGPGGDRLRHLHVAPRSFHAWRQPPGAGHPDHGAFGRRSDRRRPRRRPVLELAMARSGADGEALRRRDCSACSASSASS